MWRLICCACSPLVSLVRCPRLAMICSGVWTVHRLHLLTCPWPSVIYNDVTCQILCRCTRKCGRAKRTKNRHTHTHTDLILYILYIFTGLDWVLLFEIWCKWSASFHHLWISQWIKNRCVQWVIMFMALPSDIVDEGIMFSGCLSICLFVQTGLVTTMCCEWLEQSWWNLREYLLTPTDDLVRFWKSKVKVTAGCRGGRGVHVDAWAASSSSS